MKISAWQPIAGGLSPAPSRKSVSVCASGPHPRRSPFPLRTRGETCSPSCSLKRASSHDIRPCAPFARSLTRSPAPLAGRSLPLRSCLLEPRMGTTAYRLPRYRRANNHRLIGSSDPWSLYAVPEYGAFFLCGRDAARGERVIYAGEIPRARDTIAFFRLSGSCLLSV